MNKKDSAALSTASVALRVLIFANWAYAAGLLTMLVFSFVNPSLMLRAIDLGSLLENPGMVVGVRTIICLGVLSVPLQLAMLRRLASMVDTVRVDPFVPANANRSQAIAWILLALQVISLAVAAAASAVSTAAHPLHLDAGFSPAGWLAVVMAFVFAHVFAAGSAMRDDLEGTV